MSPTILVVQPMSSAAAVHSLSNIAGRMSGAQLCILKQLCVPARQLTWCMATGMVYDTSADACMRPSTCPRFACDGSSAHTHLDR
jgi:hypothetical protein